jgi:hypothetical protein
VRWQRPLPGEIPPRVQSLGAAQFVEKLKEKSPRQSRVAKHRLRDGPGRFEDRVWAVSRVTFPNIMSGRGRGSGIFLSCVRRPSSYITCNTQGGLPLAGRVFFIEITL